MCDKVCYCTNGSWTVKYFREILFVQRNFDEVMNGVYLVSVEVVGENFHAVMNVYKMRFLAVCVNKNLGGKHKR